MKKKKFAVWARVAATKFAGIYEAETAEEAIEKAENECETPTLCHQCTRDVELGDIYEFDAEEE